jgi:hypothetical protein
MTLKFVRQSIRGVINGMLTDTDKNSFKLIISSYFYRWQF